MLTDLMLDQQTKLIQEIQDKPGYVNAGAVAALVLIDILEVLQRIERGLPLELVHD